MNILITYIIMPIVCVITALIALTLAASVVIAAYSIFVNILTSEDIVVVRKDAFGYPDRRGIRVARFNIPFLRMTAGQQWGDEYPINQIQYDEWTR